MMKNTLINFLAILLVLIVVMVSCAEKHVSSKNETLTKSEQHTLGIANEAFTFGLPLILMDITQSQTVTLDTTLNIPLNKKINSFFNLKGFPTCEDSAVVRPNADTYYSIAWLNLSGGPVMMTLPETDTNYYLMPLLDGYTNVFASPGTRTNQTQGGKYIITGTNPAIAPKNQGLDDGTVTHYQSNTDIVWVLGRFEVDNNTDSLLVVNDLQPQLDLLPLGESSEYINPTHKYPSGDPNSIVKNMRIDDFFNRMNALLVNNPPTKRDSATGIVDRMAKIGVGANLTFNSSSFPKEVSKRLKEIPSNKVQGYQSQAESSEPISDTSTWSVSLDTLMGDYGIDYPFRALIAYSGLGANTIEDAVYYLNYDYMDGNTPKQLNSQHNYTLTFDNGLPPVNDAAFWSLTMYNQSGYFVCNIDSIYALGHGKPFVYGADSTLTIYIQNEPPTDSLINNWLPSPSGNEDFNVTLRAYWPSEKMLDTLWTPPNIFINEGD